MKYILLLGRIFFSSIFILKSIEHFSAGGITYAGTMGMPMPSVLVPIGGVLALLGGLSILLGYRARLGAWILVIFLIPTTFIIHKFWGMQACPTMMMHQLCFMKNLSMIGACLFIAYFGSGPLSLKKD